MHLLGRPSLTAPELLGQAEGCSIPQALFWGTRCFSDVETEDVTPMSCVSLRSVSTSIRCPIAHVARDLGIHKEALRRWVRQAQADQGSRPQHLTTSEREVSAA